MRRVIIFSLSSVPLQLPLTQVGPLSAHVALLVKQLPLKGTKLPLGDGVNRDDRKLLGSFPYIADPQSGFDNTKGR